MQVIHGRRGGDRTGAATTGVVKATVPGCGESMRRSVRSRPRLCANEPRVGDTPAKAATCILGSWGSPRASSRAMASRRRCCGWVMPPCGGEAGLSGAEGGIGVTRTGRGHSCFAVRPCSARLTSPGRVSGRSRAKTYGKDCAATCGITCPRTSVFGNDIDKSLRLFKDLRIMSSIVEPSFSGKLAHMTVP
jgi:hypothetical protein